MFTCPAATVTLATSVAKSVDVLVVGMAATSGRDVLIGLPADIEKALARAYGDSVAAVAASLGAAAKPGTVVTLPAANGRRLLVVGVGDIDVSPAGVRRATGAALRAASALPGPRPLTVAISLDTVAAPVVRGAVEGALLGAYRFRPDKTKPGIGAIHLVSSSRKAEVKQAVEAGTITAKAVYQARHWVNQAPNLLFPESFADELKELAKLHKLSVEVWDEKALERDGFGGILAVGGGSSRKPRLVKLSYAPRGASVHLALIGKGITFDSGGLNLKPADGMITMKDDMAGAASVAAALSAIADLGLKVKVTAYAALAENLPSGTAYRPSDVLTMYGGLTVENANSDAEGRLVMADALARASEEKPDLVVDVATLTGAAIIALGERVAALMARDDATADRVLDAAEVAGERFWQLPIPEEARAKLDSEVADLKSTGDRPGGALTAAAFLSEFVPTEIPWAHLDIAGPAYNPHSAYEDVPVGATGMCVRTLVALAAALAG